MTERQFEQIEQYLETMEQRFVRAYRAYEGDLRVIATDGEEEYRYTVRFVDIGMGETPILLPMD